MLHQDTIAFLHQLARNNNKPWFDKNRDSYADAKADFENHPLVPCARSHCVKISVQISYIQNLVSYPKIVIIFLLKKNIINNNTNNQDN